MLTPNDLLDIELLNRRGKVSPKHVNALLTRIRELEDALEDALEAVRDRRNRASDLTDEEDLNAPCA